METITFDPLAQTKKELIGNDLCVLADFLKGPHTYIDKELINKLIEEYKRLLKKYKEEK